MATKKGLVKKTPLEEYENVRKTGLAAIALRESWQPFQIPEEALKKAEHIAGEDNESLL